MPNKGTTVFLTDKERELVRRVAESEGLTEDEAASKLVSDAIAQRVRKKTGRTPAKVYPFKPR